TAEYVAHSCWVLWLESASRLAEAERYLDSARRFRPTRPAATVELARVLAREGRRDAALKQLQNLTLEVPRATVPGTLEVSLLRRLGKLDQAREHAEKVRAVDPTSSFVR